MNNLDGVRALIFDVGGVLMDERHTYRRFRHEARRNLDGVEARALVAALRSAVRARPPRASRQALMQLGGDEDLSGRIWDAIGNIDRPYPEAAPALARLAGFFRLAILGNQAAEARQRLDAAGMLQHCEVTIISGEVGLEKPDPRIFELALAQLGVEAQEAAMVGDRLDLDIAPARRLGLRGVRMLRGPHIWQQPIDAFERPDLTVRSLRELADRLTPGPSPVELERGET